jgi:hypothetical protein
LNGKYIKVEFEIDRDAFTETPTKKIAGMTLVIEYDNPLAYGYPEVCHWSEEYEFDADMIRRKING